MIYVALAQEEPQERQSVIKKQPHVAPCTCALCALLFLTVEATPALLEVVVKEQEKRLSEEVLQTTMLDAVPFVLLQQFISQT